MNSTRLAKSLGALLILSAMPAFAQSAPESDSQISTIVPKTSSLSSYRAPNNNPPTFPPLPPARPCKAQEVMGPWELKKVFEHSTNGSSSELKVNPGQRLVFNRDGLYTEDKFNQPTKPKTIGEEEPLNQYVAQDSGIIYFYTDGKITDSRACFIIAAAQKDIIPGQMMLMPPIPADGMLPDRRVVMIYGRVYNVLGAPQNLGVQPVAPTVPAALPTDTNPDYYNPAPNYPPQR